MKLHPLHSLKFVATFLGGSGGGGGGDPITIRDSNSNNTSSSQQWIDVNLPATVEAGDHLFAYAVGAREGLTYTPIPAGWTSLGIIDHASVASMTSILLHKIADGTEGGGTVRVSTMLFATRFLGISVAVNGGTYIETDTEKGQDDSGVNTFTVGSQNHTQDGMFLAFVSTNDDGDGGTMPPFVAPSGWTLERRRESGGSSSTLVGGKLVYQNVTGVGATGDIEFQTESLDGGEVDYFTAHIVKLHQ